MKLNQGILIVNGETSVMSARPNLGTSKLMGLGGKVPRGVRLSNAVKPMT